MYLIFPHSFYDNPFRITGQKVIIVSAVHVMSSFGGIHLNKYRSHSLLLIVYEPLDMLGLSATTLQGIGNYMNDHYFPH